MYGCYLFLTLHFIGSLEASKTDTNIVSKTYLKGESSHGHYPKNPRHQSDKKRDHIVIPDDYDDRSGRLTKLRTPMHILYPSKTTSTNYEKNMLFKTYQPREDPKLFYQSESYLKEINGQSVNKEVTYVYPGWEVIRADEKYRIPKHLLRSREEYRAKPKICIKCPHDRTLLAKRGVDNVILQTLPLTTCSGRKAPRSIRLVHMYGPKFGTLLRRGSHVLVGRVMHKNETLRLCKIQVHVVIQNCPTPKPLLSHCSDRNTSCNFTCRDESLELHGDSSLVCSEDMKWQGHLPVCRARNWCKPLLSIDVGKISCSGATTDHSLMLKEGTRCRIRCPVGWRWLPKVISVCRHGMWTNVLQCRAMKKSSKPEYHK